jgi:hypothetical protein
MSNGKISVSSRERYRPKAIVRARLFKEGCKNSLASSTVTIDEDEGVQVFQGDSGGPPASLQEVPTPDIARESGGEKSEKLRTLKTLPRSMAPIIAFNGR